jgi:hypothetical protein
MSWFVLVNNVSSVGLVLVFWILAHQNAAGPEPFGRLISAGYGLSAICVMSSGLFHYSPELGGYFPASVLMAKLALLFTLGLVAARLAILSAPDPH